MKKNYICPEMKTVVVSIQSHLLSGSAKGTAVFGTSADKSNTVLSRGGDAFWDDEDDEY